MLATLLLAAVAHAPLALHPEQPPLLPLPREADRARHLGRTLRRGAEPRFRLRALPGRAGEGRPQPHAPLLRHLPRGAVVVRDHGQHARPEAGPLRGPLGPQHGARRLRRGDEVRPLAVGRVVLPPPEGLHGRGAEAWRRRRDEPLLPVLRGGALGREPHERAEQRERDREGPAGRGLHAEARRPDRRPGGGRPEDRHRAERLRQPLLRGGERALLRRDHARVAAPRGEADRRRPRRSSPAVTSSR